MQIKVTSNLPLNNKSVVKATCNNSVFSRHKNFTERPYRPLLSKTLVVWPLACTDCMKLCDNGLVLTTKLCHIVPVLSTKLCDIGPVLTTKLCDIGPVLTTKLCDIRPVLTTKLCDIGPDRTRGCVTLGLYWLRSWMHNLP